MRRRWRGFVALGGVLVAVFAAPAAAVGATTPTSVAASPLAANGFESPSCASSQLEAQLSPVEQANCSISGVAVAPVPLSNYAVDTNIQSGITASFHDDIDSVVEDLFVTPVWTAVVWLDHVVLIALEWCYALDLLAPNTLSRVANVLGAARSVFTDPWLGLALAVAAIGFAWQGLVRRRVLDTLGQIALMTVMVAAGLFIVADPSGTVGAVGGLADRAALATVAAAATGDPSTPVATVDGAFSSVFESAISGPWCYLEFGDVNWCRDPAALDPRLAADASRLETIYRAEASCHAPTIGLVQCAPGGSALQNQLAGAAAALGAARNNGELFLALPSDALARTQLSGQPGAPTLYGTLCGSGDSTACTAPTAPQAQFRSASGTWPRVGGLLLIAVGTIGMLLLLGFLALRLLGAALATLVYLLLAPLAVLAPALGEAGRDAFRLWITRLAGATLAKLVYSVALGVALLVVTLLSSLESLGWWTQWLLISVFWWTAFEQRHRLLSLVLHERSEPARRTPMATRALLAARGSGAALGAVRASTRTTSSAGRLALEAVQRWREHSQGGAVVTLGRRASGGSPPGGQPAARREQRAAARHELEEQVARVFAQTSASTRGESLRARVDHESRALRSAGSEGSYAARATRISEELRVARASGDRRREVSLELRASRLHDEARSGGGVSSQPLKRWTRERLAVATPTPVRERVMHRALARRLDRAAFSPAEQFTRPGPQAASLAGLAGLTPREYLRRSPADQRAARLEIRRVLDRRRELLTEIAPRGLAPSLRAGKPPGVPAGDPDSLVAMPRADRRARQFGNTER